MSGMRFHKRYHGDAWDGCLMLSLEERGAYNTILDMIYMRGGRVVYDVNYLSQVMRCRPQKVERIVEDLIKHEKLYLADGYLRNARADKEINDAYHRSEQLATSAMNARQKKVALAKSERDLAMQKARKRVQRDRKKRAIETQREENSKRTQRENDFNGIENDFNGIEQLKQQNNPNEINDAAERSSDDFSQKHHCNQGVYKSKNIDIKTTVIMEGKASQDGMLSSGSDILYRGGDMSAKIPISDRLIQSIGKQRTGARAVLGSGRRVF